MIITVLNSLIIFYKALAITDPESSMFILLGSISKQKSVISTYGICFPSITYDLTGNIVRRLTPRLSKVTLKSAFTLMKSILYSIKPVI